MASTTTTVVDSGSKVEEDAPTAILELKEEMDSRFGVKCTTITPLPIDITMHAENREKVLAYLRENYDIGPGSFVFMEGGPEPTFHDTDHEPIFRQESNFHYLFGVKEPGFSGCIDVATGRTTLFCPRLPESYATWMGHIYTCDEFKEMYKVDEVKYGDELKDTLQAAGATTLLRFNGVNTDSGTAAKLPTFEGIEDFEAPKDARLFTAVVESRVIKTEREIEVMRYQNILSSEAHMAVMATCKPGQKEYQLESVFRHWCYYHGGARNMAYTCICAAGNNGATLHYGHAGAPNSKTMTEDDMCLLDMGGEYHRYGSDITVSFPTSGTFSEDQKLIYNAVLDAVWTVERAMKAGVFWPDMHELSYRVLLKHLLKAGIVVGELEELMEANIAALFMPHGLGHMLGLDTHDVGGYPEGSKRDTRDGYRSLRASRVLKPGMVITVEPGCYFNNYILDKALKDESKAKYLNREVLSRFRGFGGVRIEDDVVVRETHCDVLTHVPRTVEDIEAVMAGRIVRRADIFKPDFTPKAGAEAEADAAAAAADTSA